MMMMTISLNGLGKYDFWSILCPLRRPSYVPIMHITNWHQRREQNILAGGKYELLWKEMKMDRFTGLYPIKTRKTSFSILALTCHEGHRVNVFIIIIISVPRSGELRMQKLKSHLMRTQSLKVLPLKLGVSQYIAICYAGWQEFLPCLFLPFRSIHMHFFQDLSRFFLC